jgi:hypothetical protein
MVEVERARDFGGNLSAKFILHVGNHDVSAFCSEQARIFRAQTGCATCNDGNFTVEFAHEYSPDQILCE